MKVLGYVNRFSRGVYRVQKELKENGNGEAHFDFSLRTAFRVVKIFLISISRKVLGLTTQKTPKNIWEIGKTPRKRPEKTQKKPRKNPETFKMKS
jgi:ATP-dependent DNA helicase RecG